MVSIPHTGIRVPEEILTRFSQTAANLTDTDWYVDRLYNFLAPMGVSVLVAAYSRYVVDLNRPADGEALYPGRSETALCPTTTFSDELIYQPGQSPDAEEIAQRVDLFWRPYHAEIRAQLERIKQKFGYALLWDAHSIQSHVPRFFDGRLADLNLGTNDGASCDPRLGEALDNILRNSEFDTVRDGRFKGGLITRHYGDPANGVHAAQMEIAQIGYMSEYPDFSFEEKSADRLRPVLQRLIAEMLQFSV